MSALSNIELGQRIRQIRKEKRWTQEDLAARLRLSRPTLVNIEQGRQSISTQVLFQLSEILQTPLDYFTQKPEVEKSPELIAALTRVAQLEKRLEEVIELAECILDECRQTLRPTKRPGRPRVSGTDWDIPQIDEGDHDATIN